MCLAIVIFIFMCLKVRIINFNIKIAYKKEVEVHTCMVDQGGPESQPYHAGRQQRGAE